MACADLVEWEAAEADSASNVNVIATNKLEQNQAAIDPWTVVHLAAGLALGLMNAPRIWSVGAALGYELSEQVFERREWGRRLFATSGPETVPNAAVDMVAFACGHWLGTLWNRTADR